MKFQMIEVTVLKFHLTDRNRSLLHIFIQKGAQLPKYDAKENHAHLKNIAPYAFKQQIFM